jgi:hypothetical protein
MSEPDAPTIQPRKSHAPLVWAVTVVALVLAVASTGLWLMNGRGFGEADPTASTQPTSIRATAHDYYFHVKLIEAKPRRASGSDWDSGGDSAPDLFAMVYYRDKLVHTSPERSNALVAEWDLFSVDVRDIVLRGEKVDVASVINAPLVHAGDGAGVRIDVWDDDTMGDDKVASVTVPLTPDMPSELLLTGTDKDDWARIVVQLVPRDTPIDGLIEIQRKR